VGLRRLSLPLIAHHRVRLTSTIKAQVYMPTTTETLVAPWLIVVLVALALVVALIAAGVNGDD